MKNISGIVIYAEAIFIDESRTEESVNCLNSVQREFVGEYLAAWRGRKFGRVVKREFRGDSISAYGLVGKFSGR